MKHSRGQRALGRLLPTLVLIASAIFFAFPLIAMARFAFQNLQVIDLGWNNLFEKWSFSSITASFSDDFFAEALTLSLKLAVGTALLTLGLLIPTAVWVHLRLPKARVFVEFLTILPYVIPAIALVAGIVVVKPHARWFLNSDYSLIPFYVVLALPFTYRSIDTGLRAIDLKVLVEASRSLGSTWIATLFRVVIPNLRAAIISSTFLTVAVVLGEYTISDVLLKRTFPSFMAQYRQSDPRGGYALAILALLGTTLLFVAIGVLSKSRSTRSPQVSRSQEKEILVRPRSALLVFEKLSAQLSHLNHSILRCNQASWLVCSDHLVVAKLQPCESPLDLKFQISESSHLERALSLTLLRIGEIWEWFSRVTVSFPISQSHKTSILVYEIEKLTRQSAMHGLAKCSNSFN